MVTIAYWMPEFGRGFKSVRGGASESWTPPLGSVVAADMGLLVLQ